jgi:ribosome-associated protein
MNQVQVQLDSEYIELFKLLKVLGLADSGGAAKAVVADGLVQVDGQVELRKACKLRVGQVVQYKDTRVTILAGEPAPEGGDTEDSQ